MIKKYKNQRQQRKIRIRAKIKRTNPLTPRLSVFRSHQHLYAQAIDVNNQGKILLAVSDMDIKDKKGTKTQKAELMGEMLAQKAKNNKIKTVVFDRSGYSFAGRIRALVESAKKGGLKI